MKRFTLFLLVVSFPLGLFAQPNPPPIGWTEDAILQQMGPPYAQLSRGDRKIFMWSGGARVEIENGKVVEAEGVVLGNNQPATPPPPQERQPEPVAKPDPDPEPARAPALQPAPPSGATGAGSSSAAQAPPPELDLSQLPVTFWIGLIIVLFAGIGSTVTGIWFLVEAFKVSAVWGICVFFIPFAALFFLVKYWEVAKRPFFYSLAATAVGFSGAFLAASGLQGIAENMDLMLPPP